MNFKSIELSDREWMDKLFSQSDFRGSEYCFSSSYNWRKVYGVQVGETHGMLVIKCTTPSVSYSYPAGGGDLAGAVSDIMADAQQSDVPPVINCIQDEGKQLLEQLFPDTFDFTYDRDSCDYLYYRESLVTLAGKKLQSKRNHINKFKETYPNWRYESITPDNLAACKAMNTKWCQLYGCQEDSGLSQESCAVKSAFENFVALGLRGGLLRCEPDGEVVAYTMGRPLCSDTFIVHIEKAFHDMQGAYPMINREFVAANCDSFTYVNREDDTGAEGLRKAKLSYRPAILLDKYHAIPRAAR